MPLAVPVPANGVAGVDIAAAFWNAQVRDAVTFLANKPIFVGLQTSATTSLTNNTFTSIGLDTNTVDSYSGHSTVTNNSRYVAQVAGWYVPVGCASIASNTTGSRGCRLAVNGSPVQGSAQITNAVVGGNPSGVGAASRPVFLNVGDYVEAQGYQNSGGALNTLIAADFTSMLSVYWLHA